VLGVAVLGRSIRVRGKHDLTDSEAVPCGPTVFEDSHLNGPKMNHLALIGADD
jgi:hypothetical protein